jgi:hypothetical protein
MHTNTWEGPFLRGILSWIKSKTHSVAFSPQANWSGKLMPIFADRGVSCGQRGGSPTAVNLSFLNRNRYFFFQVSPHISSQGLSVSRSRPTATQKIS